jgi:arylsulfatase A-like enzyme
VDVLPTLLSLAGVPLPRDRAIDGADLSGPLLAGTEPADRPVYYYSDRELRAVRHGAWKLQLRHGVYGGAPWSLPLVPLAPMGPWLFDLRRDPAEAYDVAARFPEELARVDAVRAGWERELAANPRGWRE